MDNVQKAIELVHNYKRALAYLDGVTELTYERFKEAIRLAGNPVPETEIRQQWEMSKMTLQGPESLRQTYREVWEKGIQVFGEIARELPRVRESESRSSRSSRQNTFTRKWWQFWK
jgi:hypothetical protein